ncbi:enoyl-CoA hydratase-related protein [Streptomyces angustmyceticus]|uniref:enoyl-CoA hydratase-related protein n=1 Tax=Streptomyces angustmyceticus TaxID=285578 RepID=UPI00344BA727
MRYAVTNPRTAKILIFPICERGLNVLPSGMLITPGCTLIESRSNGPHFTGGLDLASLAPRLATGGEGLIPDTGRDPWGMYGEPATKPVVVAVHGRCFTAGPELVLNADLCVAAADTLFGQQEVTRGIVALGGATVRLPHRAGWGNAMRYLLTGDRFDAQEAWRMGVVQEVVGPGEQFDRATALAHLIAQQAPLAVQATLADARAALRGLGTVPASTQPPRASPLPGSVRTRSWWVSGRGRRRRA